MIANLELQEFTDVLHYILAPALPIEPYEHTYARDPQVREIEQELDAPGRTVFIYGDHEVGRVSLAQAVAAHQAAIMRARNDGEARKGDASFVIDQFDEITSDEERARFADFITQIADRRAPVRFVFCAVSESVKRLLGAHESCYSENTEVSRPSRDLNFEIIDRPAEALKTKGPHCVHLVSENLFWEMFNDPTFARSLR